MAEPRSEETLVRYFCTAGNGMEHFLMDEVKKKLGAEDVRQMPGKVLFSSSAGIDRVSELKAAERLFLLLKHDYPLQLSAHISPEQAAAKLRFRVLDDRNQWICVLMTWSRLQGELEGRWSTVNATSTAVGVTTETEEESRSKEEAKCSVQSRKTTGGQRGEESRNGRQRSGQQNGSQTLEKKRKREDEEEEEEEEEERKGATQHSSSQKNVEEEKKSKGEEERGMELSSHRENGNQGVTSGTEHQTPAQDLNVESSSREIDDMEDNSAEESLENVKTTGGRDMIPLQPSRVKLETVPDPISFRISSKCTGSLSRYLSTQEVSKLIAATVSRVLGWKSDLKNPHLEITVYLSDDLFLLGIPLTRLPLANRSYIRTTGLRSTVAWAMGSLAQIQPGSCVVDPMCGVGTILIEAAQEHKAVRFLGVDIEDGQLQKANENVEFAELGNRIHLLKASCMALPLPSASVQAVVCDLPFGRKFGTKTNMAANLPLILAEMERVLCVGGTLVLLLSPQLSCQLKKLLAQKDTGPTCNQETKPQTGTKEDCPSPSLSSTKQQTLQIHQGNNSQPTHEMGCQSGLQRGVSPSLSSLKHQATFRVSLGLIDGLIHKYVKMDT